MQNAKCKIFIFFPQLPPENLGSFTEMAFIHCRLFVDLEIISKFVIAIALVADIITQKV